MFTRLELLMETASGRGKEWWDSLTRKQQVDYIKLHPKSKYIGWLKAGDKNKTNTSTTVEPKSKTNIRIPRRIARRFMSGQCVALAQALLNIDPSLDFYEISATNSRGKKFFTMPLLVRVILE